MVEDDRTKWGPDGMLRGLGIDEKAPSGNRYVPEAVGTFASFLPGPDIARLKFELDAKQSPTDWCSEVRWREGEVKLQRP